MSPILARCASRPHARAASNPLAILAWPLGSWTRNVQASMTQIRNVGPSPSPPIVAESDSDPGRHRRPRIASRRCQGRTRPPSDATCPGRTSWRALGKPHPHPPPLRPAVACNPAPQRLFGWRRWSQCRGRSRPAELPFGGAGDAIGQGIKTVAGAPRRFWCAVRPVSTPGALARRRPTSAPCSCWPPAASAQPRPSPCLFPPGASSGLPASGVPPSALSSRHPLTSALPAFLFDHPCWFDDLFVSVSDNYRHVVHPSVYCPSNRS